jgi:ornithine--oxo-acid transaminase
MKSYPMASQEFIDLEEYYGAHNYAPLDVVLTRGQGVWGYDAEGRRYLKCLSTYSTLTQGHCHPRLLQASRLTLTSRAFCNDCYQRFVQQLHQITDYEMATGAEAAATTMKLTCKRACTVS